MERLFWTRWTVKAFLIIFRMGLAYKRDRHEDLEKDYQGRVVTQRP